MSDNSHIEWTDATWNPLVGCTKVSAGCDNCYAEKDVNRRHAAALSVKTSPKMLEAFPSTFDQVSVRPDRFLTQPLRWARPRRIFVNSLSDLFHADVPDEFLARVFAVMAASKQHTFQLLTKRHARMRSFLTDLCTCGAGHPPGAHLSSQIAWAVSRANPDRIPGDFDEAALREVGWPLPNVWLGVSVEDQHWADLRIPALLSTPAAVRWISAEPLLGAIDLSGFGCSSPTTCMAGGRCQPVPSGLHWVVAGGESGSGARPMHPAWARQLRDQCHSSGVAFLFKQWGNWVTVPDDLGRVRDRWLFGDGFGQEWQGGDLGAVAGRWDPHGDVLMRSVGKAAAGRELDGRTHDGYPRARIEA